MKSFITSVSVALLAPAILVSASRDQTEADGDDDIVSILSATSSGMEDDFDPTTAMLMTDDGFSESPLFDHEKVNPILDFAASHLGRPYRSGGKGPSAFDCSGFTSYVFKKFGYSLNPSSSTQYTQGEPIDLRMVRPGDLLFFSSRRSGKGRVGHVAMVVDVNPDGSCTFIHASTKRGVVYQKFPDGGYYSRNYVGAKRIIDTV